MRNEKLDKFLYVNRLKSSDLVEYWGITKGVVSQILNGTTKLPTKRVEELLNNPYGWDTSMLTETQSENVQVSKREWGQVNEVDVSFASVLHEIMTRREEKIDFLQARINELIEENTRLKTLIESGNKKGVV